MVGAACAVVAAERSAMAQRIFRIGVIIFSSLSRPFPGWITTSWSRREEQSRKGSRIFPPGRSSGLSGKFRPKNGWPACSGALVLGDAANVERSETELEDDQRPGASVPA